LGGGAGELSPKKRNKIIMSEFAFRKSRGDKGILDPVTFYKIQEMFAKAASMTICTYDQFSLQICPVSHQNPIYAELLALGNSHAEVAKKCIEQHFPYLNEALKSRQKIRYKCWLGFENTAIPIIIHGRAVGVLSAGGVFFRESPLPSFEVLREYGIDPLPYRQMAAAMEGIPSEKYQLWVDLLSTVANAVAFERYQQIEEKRRARRLQFVSDLSRHLGEDLDNLLHFVVYALPEACDLEKCTIFLLDEKTGMLVAKASNAYHGQALKSLVIPFKNPKEKFNPDFDVFVSSDAPHDPRLNHALVEKGKIKSLLTLPLKARDKLLGVIHFVNTETPHFFSQEEVNFIRVLASEVTLAIDSTLLHEERKTREEELNRFRQEVQSYFTQIGHAISSAFNIESLLQLVANLSMKVVKGDGCSVFLLEGSRFQQKMAFGEIPSDLQKTFDAFPNHETLEDIQMLENHLMVPLKTPEGLVGFLSLFLKESRSISQEELDVLSAFAAQTALAIKNINLFEAEQQKAREMASIYEAAKAISIPSDLNQILKETAEQMCKLSRATRCVVFLLDKERKVLAATMVQGGNPEQKDFFLALAIPLNLLEGTVWQYFRQGRLVVVDHQKLAQNDPLKNLVSLFGTSTCLLVPLLSEKHLIGLVYLDKPEDPAPFLESEVRTLMSLSIYAATSIERAQLFKQLEDQAKQVHNLYQISTALSTSLNLDRILNLIVEKTSQLVKAERFCLFMWDEEKNAFTVTASRGLSQEFIEKAVVKLEDRFVGLASYRKKPIYSPNILLETDNPSLARLFKKEGLGAVLAVPLVTKRKTIGVITLFAELGYQFNEKEIHLLGNFASHAALSIENARLYNINKQKVQELGILFDVGKRISMHLNPQDVLRAIAEQFLWVTKADGCSIMLLDKNEQTLSIAITRGVSRRSELQKKIKIGAGIVGQVARTAQAAVLHDQGKDSGFMAFPKGLREEGIQTILSVPLATKEEVLGVINLYTREKREYTLAEMHLATTLASQAAVALQNARIFEEHYSVAQIIQRSLIPNRVPALEEVEIGFQYLASLEISGDYYDFLQLPGKLGITVADVSGKGAGAAIFTSQGKYAWKAYGLLEPNPHKVLHLLNKLMVENTPSDKFISIFYGVLDYKKKEFVFANAGHLPPLLYRPGAQECKPLNAGGILLGIDPDANFELKSIPLRSGDLLLFYTDGVTEARTPEGEMFGEERLEKTFVQNASHSAPMIAQRILASVRSFTKKRNLDDDITIVVLKIK
jgi:sigma-B regulation protein RsbU (phosphoserine phosphatase)